MPDGTKNSGVQSIPSTGDDQGGPVDASMFAQKAAPTPENRRSLEKIVAEKFVDVERYRLAIEGSQDGIWDWDVQSDSLYLSPRHKGLLGYEDHEISDSVESWLGLIHPDDLGVHTAAMAAHLKGQSNHYEAELRLRRKDGTWSWLLIRGRGVQDENGRVCRVTGTATDISERKEIEDAGVDAEARARRAQDRLADAINVSADGFALFDANDVLEKANEKLSGAFGENSVGIHFGIRYAEMIAILAETLVLENEGETSSNWFDRQMTYHASPEGSVVIQTSAGRWYNLTERKTNDDGTVLMLSDVTAMKLAEQDLQYRVQDLQSAKLVSDRQSEQLQSLAEQFAFAKEEADAASRTKSEFLANMSHELRTPLNAVMGFSEVIKNELFGPVGVEQYKQYADDIYESGAHLLAIINDILDLSKVEAGKFDLNETEVQVPELCRSVIHIVKGRADDAGITLVKRLPEDPPYLLADPRSLKQMLLNLMSNAIKFTSAGGTVDLVATIGPDGGFRFDIRDTGVGIPKEHFDTVLSPFGQVDTAHARDHQGTGLGLPLVKAFIEMHDGRIELKSEVDEGTTVSLFFPPERTRTS
ncbi:MAG: two-component system cell cycle sensor histidine kinase PleC [Paracoccaceae bacterium]|jgi:two-component system cell cycle sensor histidine kinase PleC